jgi:hypothetical protein
MASNVALLVIGGTSSFADESNPSAGSSWLRATLRSGRRGELRDILFGDANGRTKFRKRPMTNPDHDIAPDHNIAEELEERVGFLTQKQNAGVPSLDRLWLEKAYPDSSQTPMLHGVMVPKARALLPELERRRASHKNVLIDLHRLGAASLFGAWRLRSGTYLISIAVTAFLITAGAYLSLGTLRPGPLSFFAALGFAINVIGLAHSAGGWSRRVLGGRSWRRRISALLLMSGASAQIAALVYVVRVGWLDVTVQRLAPILLGALLAIAVSALRTHPNPDAGRILRRHSEAARDYEAVRQQIAAEIAAAREAFENEVAALEAAAQPLSRRSETGDPLS